MSKNRSLFENSNVIVKKCKHGYFAFNLFDDMIGSSLNHYGEWCEQEFDFFKEVVNVGDVVLDIGAYIGTHTVFFAQQVGALGKVFAFEPQRTSFQFLCTNLTLNALYNVRCFQAGVSDSMAWIKLPVADPYEGRNYGRISIEGYSQGEDIPLVTIDALCLNQCNLIKVDVEGMEEKVLRGAKETITRLRPILYVENNTTEKSQKLLQLLQQLEYDCWWHLIPYYNPKNFFKFKDNVFSKIKRPFEANLVCFPKENKFKPKKLLPVDGLKDNWEKAVRRQNHS